MGKYLNGGLALVAALLLSACASGPKPLYGWGHYEESVYAQLKGEGSAQEQIDKLEQDLEKFRARDLTPPPGFYAHLGLLYLETGQDDKAAASWQTERERWPESATFFDFLMKKKKGASMQPPVEKPQPLKTKGAGA
jgi:hypothetical protein